jgi:hypothetical protein
MAESEPDEELHSWMYGAFPISPIITMMLLMHDTSSFLCLLKKVLKRTPKADSTEVMTLLNIGQRLHALTFDIVQFFIHGDAERSETMRFYAEADAKRKSSNQNKITMSYFQEAVKTNNTAKAKSREEFGPKNAEDILISDSAGPVVVPFKDQLAVRDDSANAARLNTTRLAALNLCRAIHICLLQGLLGAISHLFSNVCPPPSPNNLNPILENLTSLKGRFDNAISDHAMNINHDVPGAIDGEEGSNSEYTMRGNATRAYIMLWPLRTALYASQTEDRSKMLLARRLTEINKVHGIGMAAALVAMAKDLPSDDGVQNNVEGRGESYDNVDKKFEGEFRSCHRQCIRLFNIDFHY